MEWWVNINGRDTVALPPNHCLRLVHSEESSLTLTKYIWH